MKIRFLKFILTALISASCTITGTLYEDAISPQPLDDAPPQMTLTSNKSGDVTLLISGSGDVTVDWGAAGATVETLTVFNNTSFTRRYSSSISRTITISGKNITRLTCSNNQITSIDVSEITTLTHLLCSGNELTGLLDLSKNIHLITLICSENNLTGLNVVGCNALATLNCSFNNMNAAALDALLLSLHDNVIAVGKMVLINDNPGTEACQNKVIAVDNGWEVID